MYTVSRQLQWPEGLHVVEVSYGGIDYMNPDALGRKYVGELKEYIDPTEAVETALLIAKEWQADIDAWYANELANGKTKEEIGEKSIVTVGYGNTLGMTMPFEPSSEKEILEWAKEEARKQLHCERCDCVLQKGDVYSANDWDGMDYCNECANIVAEQENEPLEV